MDDDERLVVPAGVDPEVFWRKSWQREDRARKRLECELREANEQGKRLRTSVLYYVKRWNQLKDIITSHRALTIDRDALIRRIKMLEEG